jgi:cytoskeleton protein RodZ
MAPTKKNKPKSKNTASSKSIEKKPVARPVGQILKKARLEKGMRLTQIVQQLNISQSYIQAIENGKINELPKEQTYTIGFVKSYAHAVDLDAEEIVDKFKQEFYSESGQYDLSDNESESEEELSFNQGGSPNSKILWGSLGVALFAIIVVYFVTKSSLFDTDKKNMEESILEEAASESVIQDEDDKQLPIDYPAAQETLTTETDAKDIGMDTPSDPDAGFTQEDSAEIEKAKVTLVYENEEKNRTLESKVTSEPVITVSAVETKNQSTTTAPEVQEKEPKGFVSDPNKLPILITVTEDTWVEVKDPVNEDLYLSKVISPGYIYQIPKKGLVLSTGNAASTIVTVGSASIPSIGKNGQVLKDIPLGVAELKEKYMK